ncbi:fucose isomerase [Salibacterium salarium]|uniref:Fucose isomerase n=1 Tax=Salibacterium salarium TaxID=284579 RepID=A0A3R9QK13_9BACI|nr:RbsD/FucU domain-containing protein [Salibacterium salarium]RSL32113.1 fucose isomerase [Salibacterium salarium]
MLKGVPSMISPELIKVLMEMGHGDKLLIADGNFPAYRCGEKIIRCDGVSISEILNAVLYLFPLDVKVKKPVTLMNITADETPPESWEWYKKIIAKNHAAEYEFDYRDRFEFYEKAKESYAIIATTDISYKGNILLEKGVVR